MKAVCVTGTPGAGKTAIAKKLAKKLNYFYFDVNRFIAENKLYEGYDRKRRAKIVDVRRLNKKLIEVINFFKKYNFIGRAPMSRAKNTKTLIELNITKNKIKKYNGIIIDSHLSHCLPRKYVDFCIVAKCGISELGKRLKKRGYPKSKITENIQAEIFDVCHNEAMERKHKVIVIDTTKGFNISSIARQLGG